MSEEKIVVTGHGFSMDRDGSVTWERTMADGTEETFTSTPEDRERRMAEIEASLPPWPKLDGPGDPRSTDELNDLCPTTFDDREAPYGWVQWKGTDACVDIHCECGELLHHDGDFAYAVRCPYCGRCYELDGHIRLIPMSEPCPWHDPILLAPDDSGNPPWTKQDKS